MRYVILFPSQDRFLSNSKDAFRLNLSELAVGPQELLYSHKVAQLGYVMFETLFPSLTDYRKRKF